MASPNQAAANEFETGNRGSSPGTDRPSFLAPRPMPFWTRVIPFFTSALFFMSGIFAVFAPIPLLFLNLRTGRAWCWFAVLTNGALVYLAGGGVSVCIYSVFVATLAVSLAEFLRAKKSVERSAGMTLLSMCLLAGAMLAIFARVHHVNPFVEVRQQISSVVDVLEKNVPQGTISDSADQAPDAVEIQDWKQNVMVEFPSALAVFALVMVWANMVAVLRLNPNGIREKLGIDPGYFKKWRSPAWLVWPTIVTGVFLVVDAGRASEVALNVFKFLMAIYTIHGLSILSFFFDLWNVRGFLRAAGYLISIFVMMPLLLSLGFFDLWFDFRAKFRQQ
jgi:hypothetical protein